MRAFNNVKIIPIRAEIRCQENRYKMKVLITGGAGFIGSNVVDLLIKEGHSVVIVDNLSQGKRE